MEQRAITQMEKSRKMEKAEEKFRQQIAVYERACKEEKDRVRKIQDRHKYMMGGCVLKYFPEGYNAIIMNARAMLEQAKKELEEIKAIPVAAVKVVKTIRNEIIDVIRAIVERNNNRLTLPIMKGEFIGKISDRVSLQDKDKMEAYVQRKGWTTFQRILN